MTASAQVISQAAAMPPVMLLPSTLLGGMLLAYLIGSIPFGLILAKLHKVGDLRQVGSGNIGATNMLRAGGKKLAIATLLLDMAKGYAAVALCGALVTAATAQRLSGDNPITIDTHVFYYMFGVYAVIGHVWPIWLKYKGGKGVATALGVMLAFDPVIGLLAMACWLGTFALTLFSSLSALVSVGLSPLICYGVAGSGAAFAALLIALIVFYRHKENIKRLLERTEPKVQLKKKP